MFSAQLVPVLVFITLLLGLVLALLILYTYKLYKTITYLLTERKSEEQTGETRAEQLINQAHERSLSLLTESEQKAERILRETTYITQEDRTRLQKAYQELLDSFKKDMVNTLQSVSEGVKKDATAQLVHIGDALAQTTVSSQKDLEKETEALMSQARSRVAEGEKEMMGKVEAQIFELVSRCIKKSIGKTLTRHEHEQLVLQAFEEARHEGLF